MSKVRGFTPPFGKQNLTNDEGAIMTVAEQWKEEGREEGEIRKAKKTALSLLDQDVDINVISKATELSIDEIKKLKAENQKDFDEDKK